MSQTFPIKTQGKYFNNLVVDLKCNYRCRYHDINLCPELTNVGTSHQENLNSIKNNLRLRSTCTQTPARHLFYNILMDQYHNEKVVGEQIRKHGETRDEQ